MQVPIHSVSDLGLAIRAARKAQGLRSDDLAGAAGVGPVFLIDVEHGKETVQLGRVLRLLSEVGLQLSVDLSSQAQQVLDDLKAKGRLRAGAKSRVSAKARLTIAPSSRRESEPASAALGAAGPATEPRP